jgi:hypothetical protein
MSRRSPLVLALAIAATAFAGVHAAAASQLIARDASHVSLLVDGRGNALLTYRAHGRLRHVRAWSAINARAPTFEVPQVAFRLDYSGRGFNGGGCARYDGPPLPWLVTACAAPDGSWWAVQSWQRGLADYGGVRAPWELRLSHWSGPLPRLFVGVDWSYRRYDHLFGTFTDGAVGVYGFRSTLSGRPLDTYGRNVYVDTLDSAYGPGWRRENGFLTHSPNGSFCYGFYPHGSHPAGKGRRYRATVVGPGVEPDVMWEGAAPGRFDRAADRRANAEQRRLFGSSRLCTVR